MRIKRGKDEALFVLSVIIIIIVISKSYIAHVFTKGTQG